MSDVWKYGAIVAPLVVPWLTLNYSWRAAFAITGLIGLVFVGAALWSSLRKLRAGA